MNPQPAAPTASSPSAASRSVRAELTRAGEQTIVRIFAGPTPDNRILYGALTMPAQLAQELAELIDADAVIEDLEDARIADARRMFVAESAVERVRNLHAESPYQPGRCCCANPYPCQTIRALDGPQ